MKVISLFFLCWLTWVTSVGQGVDLDSIAQAKALASFPLLKELLSIPNDSHHPEQIETNV